MASFYDRINPASPSNLYLIAVFVLAIVWFIVSGIVFTLPHDTKRTRRMEIARSVFFEIIIFCLFAYTVGLLITGQDRAFDKRMEQIERDMSALDKINMRRGGGNSGLDTKTILKELAKLRQSPSTCGSS